MKITMLDIRLWAFLILLLAAQLQCSKQATNINSASVISDEIVTSTSEELTSTQVSGSDPKQIYEKFCAGCHGFQMKAFVDRRWKHGNSLADLNKSIKEGLVDDGMPAYGNALTDEEINALSEYILSGVKDRNSYDSSKRNTPQYYSTAKYALVVDTMVTGLEVPWGIKVTADGTIYFTERKGTFKVRNPDGKVIEIKNTPRVKNLGQGGMMDVALHPDFDQNSILYLSYSKPMDKGQTTAVIRARLDNHELVDVKEIFIATPAVSTKYHFGSRLVFDNEGYLYITVGDRGRRDDHPQFLTNACGKVHRVHEDGRIPIDNPFVDTEGAVASIWSYGHRNPQGMIYDKSSNEVWVHEHGPRGGDELNLIKRGVNYGWPTISYGLNYDGTTFTTKVEAAGMEQPVNIWTPSIGPSGMAIVEGDRYKSWEGDLLSGSLRFDYISRITLENGTVKQEERILEDIGRVRAIEMGMDGYLYVGVEESGRILRVKVNEAEMLDMR